jgi:hypothetical protein
MRQTGRRETSAVEVEVARRTLLEPEPVMLWSVLEKLRGAFQDVVASLFLGLEFVFLGLLLHVTRRGLAVRRRGIRRVRGWR